MTVTEDAPRPGPVWIGLLACAAIALSVAGPAAAQPVIVPGTCTRGLGEAYLDHNNVRARILNTGGLFYRGEPHVYEVPAYRGVHAHFAGSLWLGGFVEGQIRAAATRYGEWEYWPGPLLEGAVLPSPDDCTPYDRIYEITWGDLEAYKTSGTITENLRDWPWQLGAPVVDGDGNRDNYDLAAGDRPELIGHQRLWWVMNDVGNVHESTKTPPLGVEVRASAIATSSTNPSIDNATIYRYRFINRTSTPIDTVFMGQFADTDLGNFDDDYIAMDTTVGLAYTYNSDNDDERGYGEAPPAFGITLLEGWASEADGMDNDYDGTVDEDGETAGIGHFMTYYGGGCATCDPVSGQDYYNYMNAVWKDGVPVTYGGAGRAWNSPGIPTRHFWPGDPVTGAFWSERNLDGQGTRNDPGDRRWILSFGPFDLPPGGEAEFTFAYVWARGADNLDSITELRKAAVELQEAWTSGFDVGRLDPPKPEGVARPVAPYDGAYGQPATVRLWWERSIPEELSRIQVATDAGFSDTVHDQILDGDVVEVDLERGRQYWWRVAASGAVARGPWSDPRTFSTGPVKLPDHLPPVDFQVTANAAGPLDPPDCGAFAFPGIDFPMSCGAEQGTAGRQQSTSNAVWGIHTGVSLSAEPYSFERFVSRTLRSRSNDGYRLGQAGALEIRFTETGGKAYRRFEDGMIMDVPFEVWAVGSEWPNDPADDIRVIPAVLDPEGFFDRDILDIMSDHPSSPGDDDPYSDWIYVYEPLDMTPGEAGYRAWLEGDPYDHGAEVIGRLVLVLLDGGSELPYTAALPETGTIFRIRGGDVAAPILSAPAEDEVVSWDRARFFWQIRNNEPARLQLARDGGFTDMVVDLDSVTSGATATVPEPGRYWWRVLDTYGNPSAPSTVEFVFSVGTEEEDLPTTFALRSVYPNPFSGTARVGIDLPEASPVTARLYDVTGRLVARIAQERMMPAGTHELTLDGTGLGSGVYLLEVRAGSRRQARTVVVVR